MSSLSPRANRSEALHLQVARSIRNDIDSGVLRDGDVLPSTRELAEQWGVSVFTITEAMKLLASEGMVVSKSRSKRIVSAPAPAARRDTKPVNPQVILVGGYAGSGKTELGRILARETGWPMLDKDTLTRPVVEAALQIIGQSPNDRESAKYLELIRPREYESLAATMLENVECGNSAIVTAPFLREFADEAWLGRTEAELRDLGVTMTIVWVYCDAESMHRWIRKRSAARDSGKLSDWAGYLRNVNVEFRPPVPHHVLKNCVSSEPLQDQARALLKSVLGG